MKYTDVIKNRDERELAATEADIRELLRHLEEPQLFEIQKFHLRQLGFIKDELTQRGLVQ